MGDELKLDFDKTYTKEIKQLALLGNDGLANLSEESFQLTAIGRPLISNILSMRGVFR